MAKITASPTTIVAKTPPLQNTRRAKAGKKRGVQGKSKRSPQHRIAVHEAGHAVAAMCQKIHVEEATIVRRGKAGGQTLVGFPISHPEEGIEDFLARTGAAAITYCAGWAAETVIYGDCDFGTCIDDFIHADRLVDETLEKIPDMGDGGRTDLIHMSKEGALDLMRGFEPLVMKVAKCLLRRKTLHEEDLMRLYLEYTSGVRVSRKFMRLAIDLLRESCALIEGMGDLLEIADSALSVSRRGPRSLHLASPT